MNIKVLLFDLSRTLLFPIDSSYDGKLNLYHEEKKSELGDKYSIFDWFVLNDDLIKMVGKLKVETKLRFVIFTTGYIQEYPELNGVLSNLFDPILSAADLKVSKEDPNSFEKIAQILEVNPNEVMFVDDLARNVDAAIKSGMNATHYKGSESIAKILLALS